MANLQTYKPTYEELKSCECSLMRGYDLNENGWSKNFRSIEFKEASVKDKIDDAKMYKVIYRTSMAKNPNLYEHICVEYIEEAPIHIVKIDRKINELFRMLHSYIQNKEL